MKIFIDTAPFIYLAEEHPVYAEPTKKFLATAFANPDKLLTSVITLMEFSVKPQRTAFCRPATAPERPAVALMEPRM